MCNRANNRIRKCGTEKEQLGRVYLERFTALTNLLKVLIIFNTI